MTNRHKKSKRSTFLLAAEGVFIGYEILGQVGFTESGDIVSSRWCCNMLKNLGCMYYSPEQEMFSAYFDPGFKVTGGGWWEMAECEPRILALLMCAEMLRR